MMAATAAAAAQDENLQDENVQKLKTFARKFISVLSLNARKIIKRRKTKNVRFNLV